MSNKELYTLGIEEEFQIIHPETRELQSHVQQMIEGGKGTISELLKPELHQSVVEIGTKVCKDIKEARSELLNIRRQLAEIAKDNGMSIAAAGTHPFSHWKDQKITDDPRYHTIVSNMQMIAREIRDALSLY